MLMLNAPCSVHHIRKRQQQASITGEFALYIKLIDQHQLLNHLGGERNRNQEFRFRFRQCRYRNFWQENNWKICKSLNWFREDIFPVYFYSESESYSLKSIQRITNSLAFSCQKFRYRHCWNRNRNSWFLFRSPPIYNIYIWILTSEKKDKVAWIG